MIEEAHRVLRPGGVLILEFTQMVPLHDEPWDFFRFTRYGAKHLLEQAGFTPGRCTSRIGGIWSRVGLSTIAGLKSHQPRAHAGADRDPVRLLYVVVQLVCEGLDRVFGDTREVLSPFGGRRRNFDVCAGPTSLRPL